MKGSMENRSSSVNGKPPVMTAPPDWIEERMTHLHQLMVRNHFKGHDPFDLLNSPYLQWIPDDTSLQLLISKFGSRVAPDFLRKLLRVPPIPDPKIYACAYFGYRCSGKTAFQPFADEMTRRLIALAKTDEQGLLYWGYEYKWATRGNGINPRGASTLVPAAFAILALACEAALSGKPTYLEMLHRALQFYDTRHRCHNRQGFYLGYFKNAPVNTHNANLLGCAALTAGAHLLSEERYFKTAAEAAQTSVAAILPDGFLPYTDAPSGNWTDSFHHLYVMACLSIISRRNPLVNQSEYETAISRLKNYYCTHFINPDGTLNYYPGQRDPIDCHNYAAAIIYSILFEQGKLMGMVSVDQLLEHIDRQTWMPHNKRYMHRIYRFYSDRRFFLRWNQAWMFWALAMRWGHQTQLEKIFWQINSFRLKENGAHLRKQ